MSRRNASAHSKRSSAASAMKPIASTSTLSQSHSNPPPIQIHIPRVSNPKPRHVSEGVEKKKKYVELPGHTPVFCGDLSRKGTEAQLEALFSPYGTVMDVNIMRDKHTKNHLGYGFVIMESKREAQQAIDHLNQTDFQGRALRLGWGRKNRTLFIGDLDGSVTTATLCQVFSKFGELEADESLVIQGMDGLPLKYGFVAFTSRANAEAARLAMDGQCLPNSNQPIRIGWSEGQTKKKTCIYVRFRDCTFPDDPACNARGKPLLENDHLPMYSTAPQSTPAAMPPHYQTQGRRFKYPHYLNKDDLITFFSEWGDVDCVNLPLSTNSSSGGYGFVHYENDEEGEQAAAAALDHYTSAPSGSLKIGRYVLTLRYGRKNVNPNHIRNANNPHGSHNGGRRRSRKKNRRHTHRHNDDESVAQYRLYNPYDHSSSMLINPYYNPYHPAYHGAYYGYGYYDSYHGYRQTQSVLNTPVGDNESLERAKTDTSRSGLVDSKCEKVV